MIRRSHQTVASAETRATERCGAARLVGGSLCDAPAQGTCMAVSATDKHGGAALRQGACAHGLGTCIAVAVTALFVASPPTTQAQTLECATISKGGGVLPDGSILVIGQPIVGTISNAQFTIELGTVPCLFAGNVLGPVCGDFSIDAGEECDEGGVDTATCDADCTFVSCGDNYANAAAGEQCDDGNDIDDDACTNACQINAGAIPAASAWGLAVLSLLVLSAGTLVIRRSHIRSI